MADAPLRVLYVIRDRSGRAWWKRLHRWSVGFLDGQDGFFEAALHAAAHVTRRTLAEALALPRAHLATFDAVVVNAKCGLPLTTPDGLAPLADLLPDRPLALFIGAARPGDMPDAGVLERADILFKREPWADPGRYALPARLTDRIVPTHLSNPLAPQRWRAPRRTQTAPRRMGWDVPARADVFFLGAPQRSRHHDRTAAWAAIRAAPDLTAVGGLTVPPGSDVPAPLQARRMTKPAYLETMQSTRVNLGLEGIGPFTFRHLETLWAGAFLLSTPVIREQRLRAPLVEGQDYVAFDDLDDLVDKTRHYAARDAERLAIAKSGRAAYERLHDVPAHAAEIRAALTGAARPPARGQDSARSSAATTRS